MGLHLKGKVTVVTGDGRKAAIVTNEILKLMVA